ILKLLHPFMPFITEELWSYLPNRGGFITQESYPKKDVPFKSDVIAIRADLGVDEDIQKAVIETVDAVRNLRGEMNLPPSEILPLMVKTKNKDAATIFEKYLPYIKRLARVSDVTFGCDVAKPRMAASASTSFAEIYLTLDEALLRREIGRIEKGLVRTERELGSVEKKLKDPKFISNAPKEIVDKKRGQQSQLLEMRSKLTAERRHFKTLLSSPEGTK
ncbi:MAG: class I tRNA ligase family protein, partial [Nitrospiria bacterium]